MGGIECGRVFELCEGNIVFSIACKKFHTRARTTLCSHTIIDVGDAHTPHRLLRAKVIGARTEKYADYFDILAAIIGYVPNVGVHVDENRVPTIVIDATRIIEEHVLPTIAKDTNGIREDHLPLYTNEVDSLFPVMGWVCGNLSDGAIPLILGFDLIDEVTDENLKAFCAAFGTTGTGEVQMMLNIVTMDLRYNANACSLVNAAPLFHMAKVTPEAMGGDGLKSMLHSCGEKRIEVTLDMLRKAYMMLDSGNDGSDDVSLVALGNPHLRYEQLIPNYCSCSRYSFFCINVDQ